MQGCPELLQCRGSGAGSGRRREPGLTRWERVYGEKRCRSLAHLDLSYQTKAFTSDRMFLTFIRCYYYLSVFHAFMLFLYYTISLLYMLGIWVRACDSERSSLWFMQIAMSEGDCSREAKRPLPGLGVRWACLD